MFNLCYVTEQFRQLGAGRHKLGLAWWNLYLNHIFLSEEMLCATQVGRVLLSETGYSKI